jgi:hypothetical protein
MRRTGNMKLVALLVGIVALALILPAGLSGPVLAESPASCRYWGPVTLCGARIDPGTEITGRVLDPVSGPSWTTTVFLWHGVPYYVIDIPPYDPPEAGGVEGEEVYFSVTSVTYEGNVFVVDIPGPSSEWERAGSVYHPLRLGTLGDANLDGVVNAADIIRVQKIMAGLEPATPCADANQDGAINAADIVRILKIISGSP